MTRVLITRPEPGASETAERLVEMGFWPIVAPVLSIVAKPISAPGSVVATLLTSRNAIPSCPSFLRSRPAFAVGSATAAHARDAGFLAVLSADGNATALDELVAGTLAPSGGPLFLPVAQGQGGGLTASLRQRGFRVIRRVAYRVTSTTRLPPIVANCLRCGHLAHAMFFSTESARHFARLVRSEGLVDEVGGVSAVSISHRAAVPLGTLPWRRISVAAKPNQDAMLALLK